MAAAGRSHGGKNLVIVLSLLGAGFFLGYLRFLPYLGRATTYTDGVEVYEGSGDSIRFAVWEDAEPLPEGINSPAHEGRAALSPDGRHLVFAVGEVGLNADLFIADMTDAGPVDPRPLSVLNTIFDECAPAFGHGALYFASDREGSRGGLDLWRAPYQDGEFGRVVQLDAAINTAADESDPAPLPASGSLAFSAQRNEAGPGDFDLFLARPLAHEEGEAAFTVEPLDELNTRFDEREPAFTADGRNLVFASDREGSRGFDLYRSVLRHGSWLQPEPLEGLNSEASERAPLPSQDGFRLYYSRSPIPGDLPVELGELDEQGELGQLVRPDSKARGDLWSARSRELFPIPGRPIGWIDLLILSTLLLLALIAFLAKRWEQLEIIYKCAVVSLLLHLLLLWLFQRLHPDSGEIDLPERDALFQVRLVTDNGPSAESMRERGGELAQAMPEPSNEAPERLQESSQSAQPSPSSSSTSEALEPSEPLAENAPQREQVPLERTEARELAAESEQLRAQEEFQRRSEAAPEVRLEALTSTVPERESRALEREASPESEAASAPSDARPTRVSTERVARAPAFETPVRDDSSALVESPSSAPRELPAVAMSQPSEAESMQRKSAPAPVLELGRSADWKRENQALSATRQEVSSTRAGSPARPATTAARLEPSPREWSPKSVRAPSELADPIARSAPLTLEQGASEPRTIADQESASTESEDWLPPPAVAQLPRTSTEPTLEPARIEQREVQSSELEPQPKAVALAGAPAPPAQERPEEESAPRAEVPLSDWTPRPRAEASVSLRQPTEVDSSAAPVAASTPTRLELPQPVTSPAQASSRSAAEQGPTRRFDTPARESDAPRPDFAPLAAAAGSDRPERGEVAIGERARLEHTPYRSRFGSERERALELHGGGAETEKAVAQGLAYLASVQRERGYWGDTDDYDNKYGHVSVGKSGLCLLAFMGAGHTTQSGSQYSGVVNKGVDFLTEVQDPESGHFGYSSSYSHAIATYALAECFALTAEERLRVPIERAVAHIIAKQHQGSDKRMAGGWGYYYPDDRVYDPWPRVSITAWQVMALESARLGGIEVPGRVFKAAERFIERAFDRPHGYFRYSHDPQRLNSMYRTLPGSTPAALFALSLLGEKVTTPRYAEARRYVMERTPTAYRRGSDNDFVLRAKGNLYFWYYGTLALFRIGGEDWERWNESMKRTLLSSQESDGSWVPISLYARQFGGDDRADRSYSTAMVVLTLEVYYRYFTPLLKVE